MNRKKIISFFCLILLISNAVLLYFFFQKPPHEGPRKIIIEKLGFDDKQAQAYKKTILKHRSKIDQKDKEILSLKKTLYSKLNFAENKAEQDSLISLLGEKQEEIEQIHFAHFLEIKAICKENQLPKFEALSHELAQLFDKKPHHRKK